MDLETWLMHTQTGRSKGSNAYRGVNYVPCLAHIQIWESCNNFKGPFGKLKLLRYRPSDRPSNRQTLPFIKMMVASKTRGSLKLKPQWILRHFAFIGLSRLISLHCLLKLRPNRICIGRITQYVLHFPNQAICFASCLFYWFVSLIS